VVAGTHVAMIRKRKNYIAGGIMILDRLGLALAIL